MNKQKIHNSLNICIPPELHQRLIKEAKSQNISLDKLVLSILQDYEYQLLKKDIDDITIEYSL